LDQKENVAAKNKKNAVQNITVKIQERRNKVLGLKENTEADKLEKLKILQDKIDMKHSTANLTKNVVGFDSLKKDKIAIVAEAK